MAAPVTTPIKASAAASNTLARAAADLASASAYHQFANADTLPSPAAPLALARTFSPIPNRGGGGAPGGGAGAAATPGGGAAVGVDHRPKVFDRPTFSVLTPPPSNMYVAGRKGGVLTRGLVLKSDHFASGHALRATSKRSDNPIHVSGAPNFRQIKPTNLYGVGQPTVSGMRTVLNMMKSHARTARARTPGLGASSRGGGAHGGAPLHPPASLAPAPLALPPATSTGGAQPTVASAAAGATVPMDPTQAATAALTAHLSAQHRHSQTAAAGGVHNRNSMHHVHHPYAHAASHANHSVMTAYHNHSTAGVYGNLINSPVPQLHNMPACHWTNLREEPVVYINNRPFVLRDGDNPFRNLNDFQGIDVKRLEHIERRLKNDILREADEHDGNILVHEEDEHTGEITPTWESVSTRHLTSVMTSSEVYEQLKAEGYRVSYTRIPVPTESLFDTKHIDALCRAYATAMLSDIDTLFICNCQMGRGRSTMGTVVLYLLQAHVMGGSLPIPSSVAPLGALSLTRSYSAEHMAAVAAGVAISSGEHRVHAAFRRGEYDPILRLIRMLDGGARLKDEVDTAIDVCGRVINLRDTILESYVKAETARGKDDAKMHALDTDVKLKRYFYLLCFEQYLRETPHDLQHHAMNSGAFTLWLKGRPELQKLMQQSFIPEKGASTATLEPISDALSLDQKMRPGGPVGAGAAAPSQALDPYSTIVWNRRGAVLGQRTILKKEWFAPTSRIERVLHTAAEGRNMPNFRHVRDTPLSATAQPSVNGIRTILDFLGAKQLPGAMMSASAPASTKDAATAGTPSAAAAAAAAAAGGANNCPPPLHMPANRGAVPIGVTPIPLVDLSRPPSDASNSSFSIAVTPAAGTNSSGTPAMRSTGNSSNTTPAAVAAMMGSAGTGAGGHARRESYVYRPPAQPQRIVWVNLREEPVIYIGSNAYLLRDSTHPYRTMPEFGGGMTPDRSEQIETRLRDDIVREATNNMPAGTDARVLIHEQVTASEVRPKWQVVTLPSSGATPGAGAAAVSGTSSGSAVGVADNRVRTPRQVFEDMSTVEGYRVSYYRVPLYVDEAPGFRSFDRLMKLLTNEMQQPNTQFVFNCQRGGRRSTMAMVVSCLLLLQKGYLEYEFFRVSAHGGGMSHGSAGVGAMGSGEQELTIVSPVVSAATLTRALAGNGGGPVLLHHHTGQTTPAPGSLSRAASPAMGKSSSSANLFAEDADGADADAAAAAGAEAGDTVAGAADDAAEESAADKRNKAHARGEYKGIMSLLRILKYGRHVKEQVDAVIDYCGNVHNIRLAIAQARAESDVERTAAKHTEHLSQAIKYLESYAYLICFHSYLWERRTYELEPAAYTPAARTTTHAAAGVVPTAAAAAVAPLLTKQTSIALAGLTHSTSVGGGAGGLAALGGMHRSTSTGAFGPLVAGTPSTVGSAGYAPFPTFHEWMRGREELKGHLESLRKSPHEALKLDVGLSDELYTLLYENRNGNVLVRGSILKSDYFKGIQSSAPPPAAASNAAGHGLLPAGAHASTVPIDGAINFRLLDHFPVAGTGIPSADGIRGILRFFSGDPLPLPKSPSAAPAPLSGVMSPKSGGGPTAAFRATGAVWINLRGEPISYLQGKPFVLRDLDNPYLNLEHTGINRRRVEAQEKQLKKDVLAELGAYAGKLFLHDEDEDGNLASYWADTVTPPQVKTPAQMFNEAFLNHQQFLDHKTEEPVRAADGKTLTVKESAALAASHTSFPLVYVRTPITDEQAPSPEAFDAMVKTLEANGSQPGRVLIFNCQMGRGRTTTGLITACLWCIHRGVASFQVAGAAVPAATGDQCIPVEQPTTTTVTVTAAPAAPAAAVKPPASAFAPIAPPSKTEVNLSLLAPATAGTPTPGSGSSSPLPPVALPVSVHSKEEDDDEEEEIRKLNLRGTGTGGDAGAKPVVGAAGAGGGAAPVKPTAARASLTSPTAAAAPAPGNPPSLSIDTKAATTPTHGAAPPTPAGSSGVAPDRAKALMRGWYRIIQSLVRVLSDGVDLKKQVDRVIDHCAAFQNLRECVYEMQVKAADALPSKREAIVRRGTNYLIRYFYLICFAAYFHETCRAGSAPTRSFQSWLGERPEIQNMVANVVFPEP